jgi:eukaryotic-like serine/threonine-protein kinase
LSLKDISRDGSVLLSRDNQRLGIKYLGAGDTAARDLSWKDWSIAVDITPDGKQILFGEEGDNSGSSYQVGLRSADGSAPVILGSGSAQSLSPDGKWALSVIPPPDNQIILLPTGPGSSKTLERGSIQGYEHLIGKWFPDSRKIVFPAYEPGHGIRCYVQSIEGGKPRAFTPDGMVFCMASRTGEVLAIAEDSRALLYSSDSSERPDKEIKLFPGERPRQWTPDGNALYLVETRQTPAAIMRYEIATGRRTLWKQIPQQGLGANAKVEDVVITPDGQSIACTYAEHSSDLYVVSRLK